MYTNVHIHMYIYAYIHTDDFLMNNLFPNRNLRMLLLDVYIYICIYMCIYVYMYIYSFRLPGRRSWRGAPCQGFHFPAWDSPNSSLRSAKWVWDRPEGGCHRPFLEFRNRRLKERDPCASTGCGIQGMVYGSRPPAGPMPILLSTNRNLDNHRPIPGQGLKSLAWGPTPRSLTWDWKRHMNI